jgi:hypothetical protein
MSFLRPGWAFSHKGFPLSDASPVLQPPCCCAVWSHQRPPRGAQGGSGGRGGYLWVPLCRQGVGRAGGPAGACVLKRGAVERGEDVKLRGRARRGSVWGHSCGQADSHLPFPFDRPPASASMCVSARHPPRPATRRGYRSPASTSPPRPASPAGLGRWYRPARRTACKWRRQPLCEQLTAY